jgi:hypothetical protein
MLQGSAHHAGAGLTERTARTIKTDAKSDLFLNVHLTKNGQRISAQGIFAFLAKAAQRVIFFKTGIAKMIHNNLLV